MARILSVLVAFGVVVLAGCVTRDFKVVDALRVGMSAAEAKATVQANGFEVAKSLGRPTGGWPKERTTFDALDWRAGKEEERTGKRVVRVEFYPVGHGLFGAGQLFLFYSDDDRLMGFYRYQIN